LSAPGAAVEERYGETRRNDVIIIIIIIIIIICAFGCVATDGTLSTVVSLSNTVATSVTMQTV